MQSDTLNTTDPFAILGEPLIEAIHDIDPEKMEAEIARSEATDDDDCCEVCGLSVECDHCMLDAAAAYGKITPEQEARERAKLPPRNMQR